MVGLASANSRADAYMLFPDAPTDLFLKIFVKNDGVPWPAGSDFFEVSFDEADIQGTFRQPGDPGVFGLWLTSFSTSPVDIDSVTLPTTSVMTS
jgi:hypothetical protein